MSAVDAVKVAIARGFVMAYTENSSAQAGACNTNSGLTVATGLAAARADRILSRFHSAAQTPTGSLRRFSFSGGTVTVTSITQALAKLFAATGPRRVSQRAAVKRLLRGK